jgi:hypothetical protein
VTNISEYLNSVNELCILIEHEDGRQESMFKYVYDAVNAPIEEEV